MRKPAVSLRAGRVPMQGDAVEVRVGDAWLPAVVTEGPIQGPAPMSRHDVAGIMHVALGYPGAVTDWTNAFYVVHEHDYQGPLKWRWPAVSL